MRKHCLGYGQRPWRKTCIGLHLLRVVVVQDCGSPQRDNVDSGIKHPLHIDARSPGQKERAEPIAPVRVIGLGSSSVNLRAWAWAGNPSDGFVLQCDLLRSIKQRFDMEGIEIPFPQTTLTFAKNEVLAISRRDGSGA